MRFSPQLEALESRLAPTATPFPAGLVGPALVYEPPPGPHGTSWWDSLLNRTTGWIDRAQDFLTVPPVIHEQQDLRLGLEGLFSYLSRRANIEQAATQTAETRQFLNLVLGHNAAAARDGVEADQHEVQEGSYRAQAAALGEVLEHSDSELLEAAQGLLSDWRDGLVTSIYAGRQAYQTAIGGGLTRAQYHAALDAYAQAGALALAQGNGYQRLRDLLAITP